MTLSYRVTTDKPTIVSLTSHNFWNLDGEGSHSVENQLIHINTDNYTPTDKTSIPTGEIKPVSGTAYDFRKAILIGTHLRENDPQLVMDHGYDKNFVINGAPYQKPRLAAHVYSPLSGRTLDVITNQLGLQFYTYNGLDGRFYGISGKAYRQTDTIVLETEAFPDTPNHPQFPSVELKPSETYHTETIFHFSVKK